MKQIILITLLIYVIILVLVYFQQENLIFYPTRAQHKPKDKTVLGYTFATNDTQLNGWIVNADFMDNGILFYYGGNAEDIFYSIDQFTSLPIATLMVNYRGYGSSRGKPSEHAFFADALAIYDDISSKFSPEKTYLMGRSLGSGVASYVAGTKEVDGVILVTPFDSLEHLARRQFPFLPTGLLLKHRFNSTSHIQKNKAPVLIIYGGKDRTVPPQRTEQLLHSLRGKKEILFIKEAEHNNIDLFPEYQLAIMKFLQ